MDTGSLIATNGRRTKQTATLTVEEEEEEVVGGKVEASAIDPPAVATVVMLPMKVGKGITLVQCFPAGVASNTSSKKIYSA